MSRDTGAEQGQRSFSRRSFIKGAGLTAVAGAMAGSGVLKFLAQAEAKAEEADPLAEHQWVWVIDLRRCDGCKLCTKACQEMHYLPEEQEWIKVYEMKNTAGGTYYMPRPCMHCENTPCLKVCPVGATYRVADGAILVDQSKCIGCRMCMATCPYDARYFNWNDPPPTPQWLAPPTPEYPVPQKRGTVGKCEFCVHNTRNGKLPACVAGCPMGALYIGDLKTDLATNGFQTVKLSKFLKDNDAVRYKEELGTRPRAYYILGHGQGLGS